MLLPMVFVVYVFLQVCFSVYLRILLPCSNNDNIVFVLIVGAVILNGCFVAVLHVTFKRSKINKSFLI